MNSNTAELLSIVHAEIACVQASMAELREILSAVNGEQSIDDVGNIVNAIRALRKGHRPGQHLGERHFSSDVEMALGELTNQLVQDAVEALGRGNRDL